MDRTFSLLAETSDKIALLVQGWYTAVVYIGCLQNHDTSGRVLIAHRKISGKRE